MLNSPHAFETYVVETRRRLAEERRGKWTVSVGISECSIAKGAEATFAALGTELERLGAAHALRRVGCGGWCWAEPFVEVQGPDGPPVVYVEITPERAPALAEAIAAGRVAAEWAIGVRAESAWQGIPPLNDHPYFGRQKRLLLEHAGIIDPLSIEDYIAHDGYAAFVKAITTMTPEEVIAEVKMASVRGRGGAGFPAGIKWEGARASQAWPKYVVCNAHEGEPNVYKDRRLIESNPHLLLEGMLIACYAIGAETGYNYIGGEHVMAVRHFRKAVADARGLGLLGDNVLGTGHRFDIRVRLGSGAYVAGEEMALLESLEGKQAMPRTKPPYPTVIGFMDQPTAPNNAETLSNVPLIVRNGGAWFASFGTQGSKGTKLVTMQGPARRTGMVELEMGMTLREMLFDVYGGMRPGHTFQGLQTGGVSAGPMREEQLDLLVDFDSMKPVQGMLGSGGFVLFDDDVCPVQFALYLTAFSREESCGKCSPCRLGCPALVEILERITNGQGRPGDLELIERHSDHMIRLSLCGLGKAAPAPVLGFLQFFREEFEAHLAGHCSAGVCRMDGSAPLKRNGHAAGSIIPIIRKPPTAPTHDSLVAWSRPAVSVVVEPEPETVVAEPAAEEVLQPLVAATATAVLEPPREVAPEPATDRPFAPVADGVAMLAAFYGLSVGMRYADHQPPHVRVLFAGDESIVGLDPPRLWSGALPRRANALLTEWLRLHEDELAENWQRGRADLPLHAIEPLD